MVQHRRGMVVSSDQLQSGEAAGTAEISLPAARKRLAEHGRRIRDYPARSKVLLLEPLFPASAAWGSIKNEQGFLPPLGTIAIYTWLKHQDVEVHFLDTQFHDWDEDRLNAFLRQGHYSLVGMPLFTSSANHVFHTARLVRKALPGAVIVFGGVHATSCTERTFLECPECDFIVRREGEYTMMELLRALERKEHDFGCITGLAWKDAAGTTVINPDRQALQMQDLPRGLFADLDLSRYVPHPTQYVRLPTYPLVTQRGCPYACTFCEAHVALGKKLRLLPVNRVIEELKILKYEKGARGVYFQDSTFTLHHAYITELFEAMIREGLNDLYWACTTRTDRVTPELLALMREAGCRNILYGIESANEQSLAVIRKGITVDRQTEAVAWTHKARISMTLSFILCLPGETEEMVEHTIRYARRLAGQMNLFYLPVPYPGSELYQACLKDGGIRDWKDWNEFLAIDFDNPIYVNPLIGKEGMQRLYRKAYRDCYLTPRVWRSNLKSLVWNGGVRRYIRGVRALVNLVQHNPGRGLVPAVSDPARSRGPSYSVQDA